MILVAGGTGRLGTLVVERLVRAHQPVRVLTRDPARATHLPAGVEVSRGNVCDTAALPAAFIDVNCVVSAVHGLLGKGGETPQTVDGTGNRNLVDAAAVAGADMVLVSIMGARSDHPLELFRMKAMAERYLLDSGVPATVVRSAAFEELHAWGKLRLRRSFGLKAWSY